MWFGNDSYAVSMENFHQNLSTAYLSKTRKQDLDSPLTELELKQLRKACGCLGWLSSQCRIDLSYLTSVTQGELKRKTVRSLIRSNQAILEAKRNIDSAVVFRPEVDIQNCGLVFVADAALGILSNQPLFRKSAREQAEKNLSLDQMVDKYLEILLG